MPTPAPGVGVAEEQMVTAEEVRRATAARTVVALVRDHARFRVGPTVHTATRPAGRRTGDGA